MLPVGADNIFSTRLLIICCLVALIVRFIEKSTGSSTFGEENDDAVEFVVGVVVAVDVVYEFKFTDIEEGEVKLADIPLEHLHMFIPGGLLLFEFSEKASSITLSRVSWSREIYGTTPSLECGVESLTLFVHKLFELLLAVV